ncbi:MAG: peptidylprolyl isomerase [Clostridia bacterium]|nr:peptidylprolyl isomerase [Clostridia bacterium]
MLTKKLLRVSAMLLAAVMLLSLVGCSASREVRSGAGAKKIVATAGNIEIPYENLYYITMTRIAELKRVYGDDALNSPEQQEALKAFVREQLLTRSEALISIGLDYGISTDEGDVGDSVQERMDDILEQSFDNDRDAYVDSLNAEYLTDRYVRTYLAVEDYLPQAIVNEMLLRGEIDDSDEAATNLINGDAFLRTVHVFISRDNGKSDEENRANAAAVRAEVAAKSTDSERYDAMRNAVGGKYNNDFGDVLGNGYYFTYGETETAYETAAFALSEYGVSEVVETSDGYYIIMRLPKDATYIKENFQALKEQSYYVTLNRKVEERLSSMTLEMTKYGNSLDLMDLPKIDADGGEAMFVISIVVAAVLGAGAIVAVVYFLSKKRGKKAKKSHR